MKVYASVIATVTLTLLAVSAVAERREVFFTVEQGLTRIEYGVETLFLDYSSISLFRIDTRTNECVLFPFSQQSGAQTDSDSDTLLWEKRGHLFGKVELGGEKGTTRRLLFGPDMMRLRTVISPELSRYGQSFFPGIADFIIQYDHHLFPQLEKIAEFNEPYYESFPLLRQIDLLGLLRYLDGVPLLKNFRTHKISLEFEILPDGELRKSLPDSCL